MATLGIKDNRLIINFRWWEVICFKGWERFCPVKNLEISLDEIKRVSIEEKMPVSVFTRNNRPIVNLPGLICIGEFYPTSLEESELWCFTVLHKSFLTLAVENNIFKKIVLGMSKEQAKQWCCKLNKGEIK